ncbi:MAG: hypothetical protein IT359_04760 [Gemmatimonadaceae bacterium]|nr:hypothetical protein [Gemmatimonadaceae bacterium]
MRGRCRTALAPRHGASAWHRLPTLALLLAAACSRESSRDVASSVPAGVAQSWVTTPDRAQLLARQPDVSWSAVDDDAATPDMVRITVDTAQRFQEIAGFGAALTDASAWLLVQRLAPAPRTALLRELFSERDGIGLGMVRITIGASDFSRSHYTFDDVEPGARDDSLTRFSMAPHHAEVLPLLRAIRDIQPAVQVMATPWSAPAWMKTTQSLYKGTLRDDAYPAFAEYLARALDGYAREGVPVDFLSVQNEPQHEPEDYPGMRFDAPQRARFIGQHLGPLLQRRGSATRLLDWDHNWDAPDSPSGVLADTVARRFVSGVAWHCYAGDVSAQSRVHEAHPDKDTWFTECSGGAWAPNFGDNLRWNVRTLIIGTTRHWARGVMLWNLVLDERHGPHAGGCNDCRGVVTIDSVTGGVTRNEEYYALAHASRFVRRGARRVASTTGARDVETVAFQNPDGSKILIAVNASGTARRIALVAGARRAILPLPAGAVSTTVWR